MILPRALSTPKFRAAAAPQHRAVLRNTTGSGADRAIRSGASLEPSSTTMHSKSRNEEPANEARQDSSSAALSRHGITTESRGGGCTQKFLIRWIACRRLVWL